MRCAVATGAFQTLRLLLFIVSGRHMEIQSRGKKESNKVPVFTIRQTADRASEVTERPSELCGLSAIFRFREKIPREMIEVPQIFSLDTLRRHAGVDGTGNSVLIFQYIELGSSVYSESAV